MFLKMILVTCYQKQWFVWMPKKKKKILLEYDVHNTQYTIHDTKSCELPNCY